MKFGVVMKPVDGWIYTQVTTFTDASTVAIVGPADKRNLYEALQALPYLECTMYDFDPQRADENIVTADVIFDLELKEDLIINYACEKMWPLGKMYKGKEFILVGDNEHHNGDCNPIHSIDKLIEDNELTEVFDSFEIQSKNKKYKH